MTTKVRERAITVALIFFAILAPGSIALAASDTPPAHDTLAQVHMSAVVVAALLSVFVPIVTGLITKLGNRWKGMITLVLTAVVALVTQATMADGSAVIGKQAFFIWVVATASSLVAYNNAWKPLNITSSTPTGKLLPTKGLA